MVITYHDETCFRIQSGSLSLVVDPASEKFKADAVIKTSAEHPLKKTEKNVIAGAGEYEISGISIKGTQVGFDKKNGIKTIFEVTMENIALGFLGKIDSLPDPELMEKIGNLEIVFLPVGKGYLDEKSALKLLKQTKANIVIPYPQKNAKDFLDEMGGKAEVADKLTIKKKDILEMGEKTKAVCLKA